MLRFAMVMVMLFGASSDSFAKLKTGKQPKVVSSGSTGKGVTVRGP
jgi:hypothetical protein